MRPPLASGGTESIAYQWATYRGAWHPLYAQPDFFDWLQPWLLEQEKQPVAGARQHLVHSTCPTTGPRAPLMVKQFARQSVLKDRIDRQRGSKAERSFRAGLHLQQHEVGTPFPAGYVEQWQGARLMRSYYFTQQTPDCTNLHDALVLIFRQEPDANRLLPLLQRVAHEVRRMHDSGFQHRDMGNQNILLRCTSAGWEDVQFIDLNRGRIRPALPLRQRAFDFSRLALPSDFLRVFKCMYFGDTPVPALFERWEQHYRRRFAWHTATRAWRHPIRYARTKANKNTPNTYPPPRDIWIWDEKSAQALVVWQSKDRHRYYSTRNAWRVAGAVLRTIIPVTRQYRQLKETVYTAPVDFSGRIGVALSPTPERWPHEQDYLAPLGPIPVMVRFYHHETEKEWAFTTDCVRVLVAKGHAVSVALVQDRRAVRDRARWAEFVQGVFEHVGNEVEWIEIGHAVNRVKWGCWDIDEYRALLEPVLACKAQFSARLMGPAIIDFEYHYLTAFLQQCADYPALFDALSLHLYVDRRGPPENTQAGFSTLEKCVLARAIAARSLACAPRLIISEVNWPLAGTGAYSPIGAPYVATGPHARDTGVTAEAYAHYMLRYLLIALASGMAERVFWWRLAAHGFGLVDDVPADHWQPRPAYHQLQTFLNLCGNARFIRKEATTDTANLYVFQRPDGEEIVVAYAYPETTMFRPAFAYEHIVDANGQPQPLTAPIPLTASPVYFRQCRP